MADARQNHWDEVYGAKAEDEVSWFESAPRLSLDLIGRVDAPFDAPIIDVGGGLSRLADALMEGGHSDVTVLDISAEAIAKRNERSHLVQGIVADVTTWEPKRRYHVWHDRAVLHFLTEEADRQAYRRVLLAALKEDGQAIIATFAPSGPERCSGLQVRRYGRTELEGLFGRELEVVESFEFDHPTPWGAVQRFHVARLRRGR